jgi:hypothetical protein
MSAPQTEDRATIYQQGLDEQQLRLTRLRRWTNLLVVLRLADLLLLLVLGYQVCTTQAGWGAGPGATVAIFIALSVGIAILENRTRRHEAAVRYFHDGLARLEGRPVEGAPEGNAFADVHHPYASDLDILGPSSIFALICMARTGTGQSTLARWLLNPAPADALPARQQAVAELRDRLPLRLELWLLGSVVGDQGEHALDAWLAAPVTPISRARRLGTALIGLLGLVMLLALWNPAWLVSALIILPIQRLHVRHVSHLCRTISASVYRRADEFRAIGRLAAHLRQQSFTSPKLGHMASQLADSGQHIRRLVFLVDWLESRRNPFFGILAGALLIPEQLCMAIECWRARHGQAAQRWLAAIGEAEALTSLATFAFEHPAYPFPEVRTDAAPAFVAIALGHPLIPARTRVTNDVQLGPDARLLVVTGSNMSGKSTLLRTVGVNAVLAQAGAPVCASSLCLTPLHVGASLRAQDSLAEGVSRFFAEIKRLHAILSLATQERVLFLLDEILNGTNSQDRREGAEEIVRQLLHRHAIGLVTTHDLALAHMEVDPPGVNVHFQDGLENDRLVFDYRMRPGVVSRRNALALMRLVGIEIPSQ